MEQIRVVSDFQDNEIRCPKCQSIKYTKYGKKEEKQIYKCKVCNKQFTETSTTSKQKQVHSRYILPENISSPLEMKSYDVWDLRILGKKPEGSSGQYSVNFYGINLPWLKIAIKEFIWSLIPGNSTKHIISVSGRVKKISDYIQENDINLEPQNFDREFVTKLVKYIHSLNLKSRTINAYISDWQNFVEYCQKNNLLNFPKIQLFFSEDRPKREKSLVKDIPLSVLRQLDDKIKCLPIPIQLTIAILRETGMRIDEVCNLKLNCITQDSDGDWWLELNHFKTKKENRLCITKELALKILTQQIYIRDNLGTNFSNLFCTTEGRSWFSKYTYKENTTTRRELNHFIPVAQFIEQRTIRGYLYHLAHEHNITDVSGEIYPIWKCHRFRHTHLTDLARKGTGIAHIMQRAGHASPQMAMQYIHLTNDDQKKKMKEVWDNTHFNMEGEIVAPVNPDLDTAEIQWIKKGMGMQTTDNGYCTLLWTQTCPHQDLPCKGCGSWVTTLDFLDSHKKELEETEKIIENARQKGYQRQIEKNVPRAERLRKIISGMEKHQTMRGLGHNEWEEKE